MSLCIESIFYFKILFLGIVAINITYLFFAFAVLGLLKKKMKFLVVHTIIGVFYCFLDFSGFLYKGFETKYTFGLWPIPTFLFTIYLFIWFYQCFYGFYWLLQGLKTLKGIEHNQVKYFLIAAVVGFGGGATNWPLWFNINFPPYFNLLISLYLVIVAYAIIRYHLMDIKIAVIRVGIFAFVYMLVLGVPLLLFYKYQLSSQALWLMLVLATAGPFIYLYLQRKAENHLLADQKRYQMTLRQASKGMGQIRNLDRLFNLIVHILSQTVRINGCAIFLLNESDNQYWLKAHRGIRKSEIMNSVSSDAQLINHLQETRMPIVYEEMKMQLIDTGSPALNEIVTTTERLGGSLVLPCIVENRVIAFVTLGKKKSNDIYSDDDLLVFSILADHTALAIENCYYWEVETRRMQEDGLRERTVSLEYMASSIAHEIDNPMHIVRQSLEFVRDFLLKDPRIAMPKELRKDFEDAIARSLNAAERVSGIVKAIMDYSRMGTGELGPMRIEDAVKGFENLVLPQIKTEKAHFTKEIEENLPLIMGERVQMGEIFTNFVHNALHAIRRKEEKFITLKIFKKNGDTIRVECSDNGYGIPREIIGDIFLPSTTTKGSSEGTGLGLFRVKRIVDLFKGKVWAESEGKDKGATFIVELPVYKGKGESAPEG